MKRLFALTTAAALGALASPAAAQDAGEEARVNTLIIYGDDECPVSTDAEITVCARKAESERFRIPAPLRFSDDPDNVAWAERVERYEAVGDFGGEAVGHRSALDVIASDAKQSSAGLPRRCRSS